MAASDTSVLVIDDSSSATNEIEQVLFDGGFHNIHFCKGAVDALQFLEEHPPQILLTAWDLSDLDGIELCDQVRELDESRARYTYTIVFSDRAPNEQLLDACRHCVDGFLDKRHLRSQLLMMVYAGERISLNWNGLVQAKAALELEATSLRAAQSLDPLTGLINQRMAEQSLTACVQQVEARGGAVCYLLIGLKAFHALVDEHGASVTDELVVGIARRLRRLVRPLDLVAYLGLGRFGLILLQPSLEHCRTANYHHILDGLVLRRYKTSNGYLAAEIGVSMCSATAVTGPPAASKMMSITEAGLEDAYRTGEMTAVVLAEEPD